LNRERFVEVIRIVVQDAAVADTISLLSSPPGRRPKEDLVARSKWFNALSFQDRQQIERIIEMTERSAVFGIPCVLDGARAIEDPSDKGVVDLRYRRGDLDISLNDKTGPTLHDLLAP